jgi:monomeric sarcosine oxidase
MPRRLRGLAKTNSTFDVAVVGAGVFGAWTSYQLQRAGLRVVLLDAFGAGNGRSSSAGESRIMRMGYGADEIYTRSALRALQLWREFFQATNEPLFQQTGVLWLAHEGDPYPANCAATLRKFAIPFEKLTTPELRQRYPQIGLEGISWALFEPDSGVLFASRAVQLVAREIVRNGADYLLDAVKSPAVPGRGRQLDFIETRGGRRISAGNYVFACGPWLPKIFPDLLADRIHVSRQEVVYFGTPAGEQRYTAPSLPTWIDFKDEAYALPNLAGLGIKIAIDRHGPPFDPDTAERVVSEAGLAETRRYLARRLPDLKDAPVMDTSVCQYENTSNGDFLIDLHPEFANVWLVGGGSGHGFKHGPAVGEYVAARIAGTKAGIEPRFSLATKAREQQRAVY